MNRIKQFFTGKRFLYGSGSVIMVTVFIAVAILVNLMAGVLTNKFMWKIDFTANKLVALSTEAKEALSAVDKPVTMTLFMADGGALSYPEEILKRMEDRNKNLVFQKIDPSTNPGAVRKFAALQDQIQYFNVAFECGSNIKIVNNQELQGFNTYTNQEDLYLAESKYIAAIQAVTRERAAVVNVTTGHGEGAIEAAMSVMEDENFQVKPVNLLSQDIATDCDLVLIPCPKTDFAPEEIAKLEAFLKQGKNMQVYFDMETPPLSHLEQYLKEWGIGVGKDYVVETDKNRVQGGVYATNIIPTLISHPITDGLIEKNVSVVIPGAKSITPLWDTSNGITAATLATSSNQSFATEDMEKSDIKRGEQDKSGPISLIALSTRQENGGKVLVVGSGEYLRSQTVMNMDRILFVSSLVWMTTGEDVPNIVPKSLTGAPLDMTQMAVYFWNFFAIGVLPGFVFIAGIITWIRRRHL